MAQQLNVGAAVSPAYQDSTTDPGGESNGIQGTDAPRADDDAVPIAEVQSGARPEHMNIRSTVSCATWNVRTMLQSGKLDIVTSEMDRLKISILGISETRWSGSGHFVSDDGHTVFYSGGERRGSRGVAFIVDKSTAKCVLGYNPISDRIMTLRVQSRPFNVSLVQVYVPTSDASDDEITDYYEQLASVLDTLPSNDIVIVKGDFNARIGRISVPSECERGIIGRFGLGERNDRGVTLVDFCVEKSFAVMNTVFDQPFRRLYTWTSPDGKYKNQIDFILVQKRWKSSINLVKTYPGADCGSDHELLVYNLRIKLSKKPMTDKVLRLDVSDISDNYKVTVSNRFEVLLETSQDKEPEEIWQGIKTSVTETAEKMIKPVKRRTKPWFSQGSVNMIRERRRLKENGISHSDLEYRNLSRRIQRSLREDKQRQVDEVCKDLERAREQSHSRDMFKCVKRLKGKFTSRMAAVKDQSGIIKTEENEIKDRWKSYCAGLYEAQANDLTNDSELFSNFTKEPNILKSEVEWALRRLGKNKAAGSDSIPSELICSIGEKAVDVIWLLCNKIWDTGNWPKDWKKSVFIPLYKKGDSMECKNYRTISLISHTSKILLYILNNRMESFVEREIPQEQAGFMKNKGTRDQIANLRQIIEKANEFNRELHLCFVDYRKAFDTVHHNRLWKVLVELGVPVHLVMLMRNLYDGQVAQVRTVYGESDEFTIGQGVRQGCILSPRLFNLYAESIMRECFEDFAGGLVIGGRRVNNLRYADDTTIITDNAQDMQFILNKMKVVSERYGLVINADKTKMMSVKPPDLVEVTLDSEALERVDTFNYLGAYINNTGGCTKEILCRIGQAKSAMNSLSNIWKNNHIHKRTKTRLVHSLIFSIVTYACENWVIKAYDKARLEGFEMWCWRRMLNIPWTARRTNESVLREVGGRCLMKRVRCRILKYFGHVARRTGDCLEKVVMQGRVAGSRTRGRPKRRYADTIKALCERDSIVEVTRMTGDRTSWRGIAIGKTSAVT